MRPGDVLMATVRPNLKAFAYFDHTNDDCIASTGFPVLTAKPDVDPRFILSSILSDAVTAQILLLKHNLQRIVLSAHGFKSSFVHVTRAELLPVCVCLPAEVEQERIVRILDKTESLLERELQFAANLAKTKTGLMQDLLTGKVRVKMDEAEEVAP